jgi:hypothetical protein
MPQTLTSEFTDLSPARRPQPDSSGHILGHSYDRRKYPSGP